jgi:sodium/hydrogen antiporter
MSVSDLAIVAVLVFCWGALSARLERFDVTAPIIFVLAGLLLTHGPLAFLSFVPSHQLVKDLAEFTLALLLFSDASRVGLHGLRTDAVLYARLLGLALPLTIGLGTLLALVLTGTTGWLALLVGAALAPTDAALGAGMISNPVMPAKIRRLINVESGLNDGRPAGPVARAVRGGGGRPGVPAGLAGFRRRRGGACDGRPDLANGALRGPQPHRRADGAGHGRAGRRTARPGNRRPGGLVRPPGTGVGGLRTARA